MNKLNPSGPYCVAVWRPGVGCWATRIYSTISKSFILRVHGYPGSLKTGGSWKIEVMKP